MANSGGDLAMSFITGYQGFFNPSQQVVIAAGETESGVISCGGMVLTGIILPSLFTGSALTFLVGDSALGYQAKGQISFGGTCTDGDTLEINGVTITFVDADPVDNEVLIGATAQETADNLVAFLAATEDEDLLACTYEQFDTLIVVTAVVYGTDGNAITFDKSSSDITLSPAGGTLAGGGFRPLYNSSNSQVSMTVTQGRTYAVDPTPFQGVGFLKLKSGSTEATTRVIYCTLKGL